MSYSVSYNPELKKRYPIIQQKKKLGHRVLWLALCAVSIGVLLASNGWLRYLLPGDPDVTAAAFSSLVERVASGVSVKESIYIFCEEILTHAA